MVDILGHNLFEKIRLEPIQHEMDDVLLRREFENFLRRNQVLRRLAFVRPYFGLLDTCENQ